MKKLKHSQLAKDLGIGQCYIVGSKTRDESDRQYIIDNLPQFEVLGFINHDPKIAEADRLGIGLFDAAPEAVLEVRKIRERLQVAVSQKA